MVVAEGGSLGTCIAHGSVMKPRLGEQLPGIPTLPEQSREETAGVPGARRGSFCSVEGWGLVMKPQLQAQLSHPTLPLPDFGLLLWRPLAAFSLAWRYAPRPGGHQYFPMEYLPSWLEDTCF